MTANIKKINILSSLTKNQKESIGLLSIGTCLEYFDLMLYVHMAVLLNELFFPKTDPKTASIIAAFAFCSTYLLRPIGALIFGYIGDHIGRKATVIITTFMMAISCLIMANLPTYATIGITATWLITLCRVLQGLSSMGEIIGAEIYLTEVIKAPLRNSIVTSLHIFANLGSTMALGLAVLVTSYGVNWRLAFWAGAFIAVIGASARSRLRETPEFANAKRRLMNKIQDLQQDVGLLKNNVFIKEKLPYKTNIYYFFTACTWPVWFYLTYIYSGEIMKNQFGFTTEQIIQQNFIVSFAKFIKIITLMILSYTIHPLKLLKYTLYIFSAFAIFYPILLGNLESPFQLFLTQCFILIFAPDAIPASPIFYKHLPIFKRFTYSSFVYALSRTLMSIIITFGVVILVDKFSYKGLYIILIPILIAYAAGRTHFENLERKIGEYK